MIEYILEPIAKLQNVIPAEAGIQSSRTSGPTLPDQVEDKFRGGDSFLIFANSSLN